MARPILPPRGYFIPTHMIYYSQLPPAVFEALPETPERFLRVFERYWLQLRSLTWGGQEFPSLFVQDWLDLTGTSRTTFHRHLNHLQALHVLQWHCPKPGWIKVSFCAQPHSTRASEVGD